VYFGRKFVKIRRIYNVYLHGCLLFAPYWLLDCFTLRIWRWRQPLLPNRRWIPTGLHVTESTISHAYRCENFKCIKITPNIFPVSFLKWRDIHLTVSWDFFPLALQPPWALASDFFSFMIILQVVGLLGRVISSSQGLYLCTGEHKHRINTYT
jgi:hypothetical protein